MTAGGHRAARKGRTGPGPVPAAVGMLVGAAVAAAAWLFLVGAAIDFGGVVSDGRAEGWLFLAAASTGAVICLVLVLVLVARALRRLGVISDYRPRRAGVRRSR